MKSYEMKFSFKGLIAVILVMIPNVIYAVFPHHTNLLGNDDFGVIDIFENIFRFLLIALLIILVNKNKTHQTKNKFTLICELLFLTAYYIMWVLLFLSVSNSFVYIGLAVFPCAFFIITAMILRNYPAMITAIIFAALHIIITCKNYL